MTVSVICEECGKVYHVLIAKLDQIKSDVVKTKCKDCGHIIHIQKEEKVYEETQEYDSLEGIEDEEFNADDFDDEDFDNLERAFQESAQEAAQEAAAATEEPAAAAPVKDAAGKPKAGMGLRTKMIFLFMVIPLLLMTVSAFLTQRQLNLLTKDITIESAPIVKTLGERSIADIGKAVAAQCKLYLEQNPALKREDMAADPTFAKLAIQKVVQPVTQF